MNRRHLLSLSASALTFPTLAFAVPTTTAQTLVDGLVAEVNIVIAADMGEAAMIDRFAAIFDKYSDVPTIARYCLGVDARSASPAQMRAYTAAFRTYIAAKYGRRFQEFVGGEIVVVGAKPVKAWVEVETSVRLRGRNPFQMDWHVSDRSGRPAFFNFIIEGVNMLLTERAETGAMLDRQRGDLSALTAEMNAT